MLVDVKSIKLLYISYEKSSKTIVSFSQAKLRRFLEKSKKKPASNSDVEDAATKEQVRLGKKVSNLMKKQKVHQIRHIVKRHDDSKPWGQDNQAKVGSRLIQLLMETAYIQAPVDQSSDAPPDIRPAFIHTKKSVSKEAQNGSRRYGVIQCDPLVRKGLEKTARHMVIPYMPMVVPPLDWTGYDRGAHLFLPSYIMRTHGARQQRVALKSVPKGQLDTVYEALNTLGNTKWRINKKVLSIIDRIWASGGCLADLVDREDVPIPEEPDTEDASEIRKWKWKVKSIKKENAERHSQRCDVELKLAVARKMKDDEGFYYPHNLDFRGRAYPMHPHLNHLGSDLCRGILEFAEGRPLRASGLRWLKIHMANLYGGGVDKLSYEGRMSFTENHLDDIFDSADRPLEGGRWWLQAEDPFQCLAACMNLTDALRSSSPEDYVSYMPVHQHAEVETYINLKDLAYIGSWQRCLLFSGAVWCSTVVDGFQWWSVSFSGGKWYSVVDFWWRLIDSLGAHHNQVRPPPLSSASIYSVGTPHLKNPKTPSPTLAKLRSRVSAVEERGGGSVYNVVEVVGVRGVPVVAVIAVVWVVVEVSMVGAAIGGRSYCLGGGGIVVVVVGMCVGVYRVGGGIGEENSNLGIWDGSCNGLQHYAALGRDKLGAKAVNLVAGDKPADVYSNIAKRVLEIMRRDAEKDPTIEPSAPLAKLLLDQVDRKLVKQTVMTSVYGVTYIGARDQIKRRLKERDVIADDNELFSAACYAAKVTMTALGEMFEAARSIMSWLGDCAKIIAAENQPVQWTTPLGLPVVQPYRNFGRRLIKTSLQMLTLRHETDKIMGKRQRSAFPPNFVHSLDGSHMMMTAIACKRLGLSFAGVHDSYWTHACDVDEMNRILREKFVELYELPILENLLESFQTSFPNLQFPPLPERGDFDLRDVLDSQYFFN
ncbi:hypothetical protein KSS87_002456 [Heliosperma pusillum]|nr:hypothetical protein KSS87_002456 [Heliosperma pusillum]